MLTELPTVNELKNDKSFDKKWTYLIVKSQKRGNLFTAKGIFDAKQEALTLNKINDGK